MESSRITPNISSDVLSTAVTVTLFKYAEKNPSWYDVNLANVYRGDKEKAYKFLLTSYKRYFYELPADIHVKSLKNLAAWGKEAKIASLKEDFAKLKPHVDRISAKNKAAWAEFVKTYDEIVKGL